MHQYMLLIGFSMQVSQQNVNTLIWYFTCDIIGLKCKTQFYAMVQRVHSPSHYSPKGTEQLWNTV